MLGFLAGMAAGVVVTGAVAAIAAVYILKQSGDYSEDWWG